MTRKIVLAGLMGVLASACATPGRNGESSTSPPGWAVGSELQLEKGDEQPSGPSSDTPASAMEMQRLSLEEALTLAESTHPDLIAARASVEAAEGRTIQAGLFPNPSLVGRMESAPMSGHTAENAEYVAGLSQRIPLGGRLSEAARVAELEKHRLRAELEVRKREVRRRVHGAFATALFLERTVDVQAEAVRIAENGVAVARARLDAGATVPEEVARVEIELIRARLEESRATSLKEQARVALASTMGRPDLHVQTLEGDLNAALEVPTLETLASGLGETPMAASAEAEIALQRTRVDLALAERIPDVSLDLFYRRLGATDTSAFDVGLAVALPLFDGNQGRVREARAELSASHARAQAIGIELGRELRESYAALIRSLNAARVLRDEILPRSETVLRAAEARYEAGDTSLTEILPVRREWTAVKLSHLDSLREIMQAWADLSPFLAVTSRSR